MPRARSYAPRSRGPRPRYLWTDGQLSTLTQVTAGAQAIIDLLQDLATATKLGLTLVRLLMRLYVQATSTGTDTEFQHGVMVVTTDAFSAGAVPDPVSDRQNWWLHDGDFIHRDADAGPAGVSYHYDIRTARKLPGRDHALLHTIENSHASGSLHYQVFFRILLRLP